MLARHQEAGGDFRVASEADGNAAPVVAVVGLGDDGKTDALRGAHRLALALHHLLLRNRQAQRREDLVGFFLVAREFDRDVRCAPRHRGLDALLVLAMAELHQRLVVEAQKRNAALLGGAHQRSGRRSQGAALRKADELIAGGGPAPALGHRAGRADRFRQQRAQQPQAQLSGGDAFVALLVFVDHGVDAGRTGAAGLAEGDCFARQVLQFDGHVLEHVAEPGAFVLAHAAVETARLFV